ncbi:MAG: hypothetical protein JWP81_2548 [Ferruginibacter sp.]|nr:hypothetical protein [Ferruginibacter sp.]
MNKKIGKNKRAILFLLVVFHLAVAIAQEPRDKIPVKANIKDNYTYTVKKLKKAIKIDGNWNKAQWRTVDSIELTNYMGQVPIFRPTVHAKMMYDDENLYVIFLVKDRYVSCTTQDYNGPVYKDACVEFFFSPDTSFPKRYFNLEINCGGTPLMGYNAKKVDVQHIKEIEIAHSLPQIVNTVITEPVTWTIEYRIPLAMLEKYSNVTHPKHGVIWDANFYKIAEKGYNPHYITWSFVNSVKPNFHLPQFFGKIKFQ